MIGELEQKLRMKDSYIVEYNGRVFENNCNRKQLIASLTKPLISYYFQNKIFREGITPQTPLSEILNTKLKVSLEQIITHSAGLWDYLEFMKEDEINSISLSEVAKKIIEESEKAQLNVQTEYPFSYSNSSYVLLSYLIEVIEQESYEDAVARFYQRQGIGLSFKSDHSRWLTGWGDGAAVCSVVDYLKFTSLEKSKYSFGSVNGPFGELSCFLGFVPGFETFVAFSNSFKFIYFITESDEPLLTDEFYRYLGGSS